MLVKIYELRDPRDEKKSPRYVGITSKSLEIRLDGHLDEARYAKRKTSHKINWIRNLLKDNIIPSIHLIEEVEGWKYACQIEIYWIKEFKEQGYNIINTTEGGDGMLGLKHSDESKRKMGIGVSKAMKLKPKEHWNYLLGKGARSILEYDNNNVFIREYKSCKEAGEFLNIDYRYISNILTGKVYRTRKYPNKYWVYKDLKPPRPIKERPLCAWKRGIFRKVQQLDYNNNIITVFASSGIAARELGITLHTVINNCTRKTDRCVKLKCRFRYE